MKLSSLRMLWLLFAIGCGSTLGDESDAGGAVDAGDDRDAATSLAEGGSSDDGGARRDAGAAQDAGSVARSDGGAPRDAGAGCVESDVARGSRGAVNDDPRFVQVFVNNVENLKEPDEECRGDWPDLVYFMRRARPQPDLFLVQQVSNRAQLDRLATFMSAQLRGTYRGIIAEADPRTMGSPCGPEKARQTNAIIYRAERFDPIGARETWQSFAMIDGACRRSRLPRTRYVMHRFHDRVADRDVNVVSMHWSTNSGSGPDPACAEHNVADFDARAHMAGFGADLLIIGGDANEPDRFAGGRSRPWFRAATRERDYRDPIRAACERAADLQRCLDANWTIGRAHRIDFLFAQTGAGCRATTARSHTITFDEADAAARAITGGDVALNYSDHRSVQAEVYY